MSMLRLLAGLASIATSAALIAFSFTLAAPGRDDGAVSTASVSQYRSNLTASTTPTLSVPTQTNVLISFPPAMALNQTRRIGVKVERFAIAIDVFGGSDNPTTQLEKRLVPAQPLDHDVELKLVSTGFEIEGFPSARQGASFPLSFTWTISPRREGDHELLLDLSDFVRDARSDSKLIGTTDVRVADTRVDLTEGTVLPLTVAVTGPLGLPGWLVSAGAALPGLVGFVLTYPLFVDWLKSRRKATPRRRSRARARNKEGE